MYGKYIRIDNISISGRNVIFHFSCSRRLRKYFYSNSFYIKYDAELKNISKSILAIPAVSVLIPIAWATGANLYVDELDETYLRSLEKVKVIMKKWHHNFSFRTKINVQKIVSNEFHNKECALLFSGGLDSIVSYIKNRVHKPHLITIIGNDLPTQNIVLRKKAESILKEFANKENVPHHFIESNVLELLNESLLNVEFGQCWWVRVSHGLALLGLCAPLTVKSIGTILIASTRGPQHPDEVRYPLGSSPLIDEKISWADVKVIHDCYKLNRQQKIEQLLKPFIEKEYHPILRVCVDPKRQELNCNQCPKCLETMMGLVLGRIDPNKCGFKMTDRTLETLKKSFLNHQYNLFEHDFITPGFIWRTDEWKEIQAGIPQNVNFNLYNSKQFFDWFRNFDLKKYGTYLEKRKSNQRILSVLKWRVLGCVHTFMLLFPKVIQNKANRRFTSCLNLLKREYQH